MTDSKAFNIKSTLHRVLLFFYAYCISIVPAAPPMPPRMA